MVAKYFKENFGTDEYIFDNFNCLQIVYYRMKWRVSVSIRGSKINPKYQ